MTDTTSKKTNLALSLIALCAALAVLLMSLDFSATGLSPTSSWLDDPAIMCDGQSYWTSQSDGADFCLVCRDPGFGCTCDGDLCRNFGASMLITAFGDSAVELLAEAEQRRLEADDD